MSAYLSATEAARRLGVSNATLYAYVSRGLVQSRPGTDHRRREYRAEDIERLLRKRRAGSGPSQGAAQSLSWGLPVLETRISAIGPDGPHYRGQSALQLADSGAGLEQVACLLWDASGDSPFAAEPPGQWPSVVRALLDAPGRSPLARTQAAMPLLEAGSSRHLSPAPGPRQAAAATLTRQTCALLLGRTPSAEPIHQQLADAWRAGDQTLAEHLRVALVLCADHELNASSFTARVVASTGASLHAAVAAGLSALSGPLHGGATARAGALIRAAQASHDVHAMVLARWQRGEPLPGFGHPLYPAGDPRGAMLVERLRHGATPHDGAPVWALLDAVEAITGHKPSIDFGLAALMALYGQAPEMGLSLFAASRVTGWLAHAIEQQVQGDRIRPRARYVGPNPQAATDH
ncbi:citrate synthase family protein [Oleiagrimonas sp. C23AA]|uniref:citrate synthase family protein n=1 Tax=Oleiagrimonas sp. C23AA TaxID=2719047 RepID=UPI001F1175CA|nr:citrate synthase family protein [Oleiagrimonas sp. C23AA]